MDLVTPGFGLVFWTTITFVLLMFLLGKFAWKPIIGAVNARNKSIEDALKLAETTKEEMKQLQADNEKIIAEARRERDALLKEAREMKDQLITQAKKEASDESQKILQAAKQAIENEKKNAIQELKTKVAEISIEIAEKILAKELENKKASEDIISNSLDRLTLN
ncbi:MAG TPA: F0F1 ATP synthase subunit B [Bacteroidales bacterium]|nr:MAG: ATP synthase subunit b [Bacteroidetes bacterium ADurb.Bin217]HPH16926.1 F0F1 ATP synthase subunit B [Bacteroidales bacterium]